MAKLARAGLTQVLVEGGGELAAALLREGLVDELHWFLSNKLLGGDGRPALGHLGIRALADSYELEDVRVRRVGDDLHIQGAVRRGAGRRRPRVRTEQRKRG
jgi:diaminohydroxyphosphoribosylaminopyrimidine deaminase/5-amino-6-(5-phosphoribosylamino)uracil reductase